MATRHLVSKSVWLRCKKTIEEAREYPIAIVVLKGSQWVVQKCPYCKKKHFHGAGGRSDNPHNFLGHRSAHCLDMYTEGIDTSPGYMLEKSDKLDHGLITNYKEEIEELFGITL